MGRPALRQQSYVRAIEPYYEGTESANQTMQERLRHAQDICATKFTPTNDDEAKSSAQDYLAYLQRHQRGTGSAEERLYSAILVKAEYWLCPIYKFDIYDLIDATGGYLVEDTYFFTERPLTSEAGWVD